MRGRTHRRLRTGDIVVLAAVAVAILIFALTSSGEDSAPAHATNLTVESVPQGPPVPASFVGFSFEYPAIESYAGANPSAVNPVFLQLIRNVNQGQRPALRIGGDSTDWTWWPAAGLNEPAGVVYSLTPTWIGVMRSIASNLDAQLTLGVNLESDSRRLASAEAHAFINGIGRSRIRALELGNEPELYGGFPWYRIPGGHPVRGRPRSYGPDAYSQDYGSIATALPQLPLAGPAVGGPQWMSHLDQFLAAHPRLGLATLHRYPLQLCYTGRRSPRYPTVAHLLSPAASTGLADGFVQYVAVAHAHGLPLRIDELNSVACGGDAAVSKTFASALWAVDALFEFARVGVRGVNVHTFPGAGYEVFSFKHMRGGWRGHVFPQYYGMMMFAQAAPPGSRLLAVAGATTAQLRAWATRATDGKLRVVLINTGNRSQVVRVSVPVATSQASVEWLRGPSVLARTGVTLGGRSFGQTTSTGRLDPPANSSTLTPSNGRYLVRLPPASAALMTMS